MSDAVASVPAPGRPMAMCPSSDARQLAVVVYHYVLDAHRDRFPRLNGVTADELRHQVQLLSDRYEIATLESALAFIAGAYQPPRSLCLLTFDDGLREHFEIVAPALAERGIEGQFFVTTACMNGHVASVHMNHCLMASVDFASYRRELLARVAALAPEVSFDVDTAAAARAYPWDTPDVAAFKYMLNYCLPLDIQGRALTDTCASMIGDQASLARELYFSWSDAREMQRQGMVIGGHTDRHPPLSLVPHEVQRREIAQCASALRANLHDQQRWPFSYPFGYGDEGTARLVREYGFDCAFALDGGANLPPADAYRIRRIDTKDLVFQSA